MAALIPDQIYGPDTEDKPTDRGSLIGSVALNVGRSVVSDIIAPAAEVVQEVTGNEQNMFGDAAKVARDVADKIDTYIPEERRKDRDAAFLPEDGQRSVLKNPGSSLVMKATGAAPSIAAYVAAGPAALIVGAAQGAGMRMSEVKGHIEKATEEELLKDYPKYVDYMTMGFPTDYARKLLIDDMLKGTTAPAMAGGAAGAIAFGGAFRRAGGRGVIRGGTIGAGEGALGGGLQGAGNEVSNQQGDMKVGKRVDYDPIPITRAMFNAGLEGGVLGGGMATAGGALGKGRDKAGDWASKQLDAKKARDATKDVEGNAPDPAQTKALAPDGPTALDAQIDAAAAGAPDALKPPGATADPPAGPGVGAIADPNAPKGPANEAVVAAIHSVATKRMKATEIHDALVKVLGADATPTPTEIVNILAGMKAAGEITKNAGGYRTERKPPPPAPKTPVLEKTPITVVEATEAAKPPTLVETKRNVPGEEASAVAAGVDEVIKPPVADETMRAVPGEEASAVAADPLVTPPGNTDAPPVKKTSTIKLKIAESAAKEEAAAEAGEAPKVGVKVVSRKIQLTAEDIKIRNAVKAGLPGGENASDIVARKVAAIVKKNMATETEKFAELAKLQAEAEAKAAAEAEATGKPRVFKRTELPPETPEAKLARHVKIAIEQHRDNDADNKRTARNVKKDTNETAAEELARDMWTDENNKPRDKELADEARKALGGDGDARKSILQRVHNMLVLAAQKHIEIARMGHRTDKPEEANSTPWRAYLNAADKFNERVKSALNETDPTAKTRKLNEAFTEFLPLDHEMRGGRDALVKEPVTPKGKAEPVTPKGKAELDAEAAERAALVAQQAKDAAQETANSTKHAGKKDPAAPVNEKTEAQLKLEEAEARAGVKKKKVDRRDDLEKLAEKDNVVGREDDAGLSSDDLNPDDYGDSRANSKSDRDGADLMSDDFQEKSRLLVRDVLKKWTPSRWTTLTEHLDAVWAQLSNHEQTLFKTIHDKLVGLGSDTRVYIVSDAIWDAYGLNNAGGFYQNNRYTAKPGLIFIPERMMSSPRVVYHEGAHAVTERALKHDPFFRAQVEQLMRDTLAALPEGGARQTRLKKQYGFHNASEFMAEVHANPQFRDMLAAIPLHKPIVTPTGTLRTMWDKVVDAVKKLFGIKSIGEVIALDRAMRLADDALIIDGDIRFGAMAYDAAAAKSASPIRPSPAREYFEQRIPAKIDWKLRTQRVLDKVASVVQMTNNSDHLFGESRPARKLAEFMGKMSTMKDKIISEKAEPLIKNMSAAQRKFDQRVDGRSTWTDFATLMHDASRAGVHPDVSLDAQFKKKNTRNWYQQEAHKDLSARYEKLPQELKDLFHEATGYFRETQNQMSLGLIRNALKAASSDGKGSEALAQRIFNKKLTDADKAVLGKDGLLSSIQKAGALSRIEGPYVPFMRRGDFVVTARHEIEAPAGARRINEEEAVDPQGNTYEFKTEAAAKSFVQKTLIEAGLRPTAVDKVGVDPATESRYRLDAEGKKKPLNIAEEPNAEPRWRVTVEPKHVEFHERASDAAESRQGLIDRGLRDVTHVDVKKLDPAKMNDAFMTLQMRRLLKGLQKREGFKKLDKNAQAELVRQLHEAGIAAMGSTRAQSHRLPRNNILGYSEDILRNTGTYASSTAGYLARLRFRPDVDAALKEMTDYTERMTRAGNDEYLPALRRQRLNELTKRAHEMNEVDADNMFHRVTSRLLQLSYLDKLASPAFHIINSFEPWTITLPVLAARHGVLPTMRALTSAYNLIGGRALVGAGLRDTYRAGKDGYHADLTDYQTTLTQRAAKDAEHGDGLVKLFNHLHDVGLMARDAGMEFSRVTDASKGLAGRSVDRADLMARQMGAAIESVNRAVSATAAYKMERRKGASHEKAMEYAVEQVHDTMKDYASWNAPPMFNHPVGRLALQFKKYAQGTYYLLGKTAVASFKGDKQAMKTFAYLMATHMLTAGALGMPLEAIRLGLIGANLTGVTDKTYEDMEQGVRAGAANVFGKDGGQIFSRGLARWAGIDLASRVSFNALLTSGQDPKSMKPDDLWAWIAKNFAGAPASLLIDGVQGFQALGKGDIEEASRLLVPLKVWADSVQAHQWATNGRKSPSGRQQMEPIGLGDALIKATGFTPGTVAERNEKTFAIKSDQRQFKQSRDKLSNDWINASPDEKTAMWREITKWNADQPDNAKIKLGDLMNQKRRRDREKLSEDRAGGMSLSRRDRHLRVANDYYNVPITR